MQVFVKMHNMEDCVMLQADGFYLVEDLKVAAQYAIRGEGVRLKRGWFRLRRPGMDYLEEEVTLQQARVANLNILETVTGIRGGGKEGADRGDAPDGRRGSGEGRRPAGGAGWGLPRTASTSTCGCAPWVIGS